MQWIIDKNNILFISVYGEKWLIGDEDLFAERVNYTTTVRWVSTKGKLYCISNVDLINLIKGKSNSYAAFGKGALSKDMDVLK